jgi:hypothetical protein
MNFAKNFLVVGIAWSKVVAQLVQLMAAVLLKT